MNYRIEQKPSFDVVGAKSNRVLKPFDEEMSHMWQKVMENGDFETILKLANTELQGIHGFCAPAENGFEYYIAAASTLEAPAGMYKLNIPQSIWLIMPGQGKLPEDLYSTWKSAFEELENSGYVQVKSPCVELYLEFEEDLTSKFEVWIAVETQKEARLTLITN